MQEVLFTLPKTLVDVVKLIGVAGLAIMEVKPLQPSKAYLPIVVTDDGIVTEVNPLQLSKAYSPIEVTDDGIIKLPPFEVGH